jgi:hypothetical protein
VALRWLADEPSVDSERLAVLGIAWARHVLQIAATDPLGRGDAGMPGALLWSWYALWAQRGLWENRYAVMSVSSAR